MLIDELTIHLSAGHGGRGAVSFQNVKGALGPTGANGGKGGDVYVEGVSDIGALLNYASRKEMGAVNGENGKARLRDGAKSEDLVLKLPVGTVITNLSNGAMAEISAIGERILLLKGGLGGKGNWAHRSSVNTTPTQFQPGLPGEEGDFKIELKMIADVGIVGFPNAGKSSLLNTLTAAQSKVGNYKFTTLEPHLGSYYGLILADIPGLIDGASEGKGLGIKFLKHIERTDSLVHLISCESENVAKDYKVIRAELEAYSPHLADKKEFVFLTKTDMVSKEVLKKQIEALKKKGVTAKSFTLYDDATLKPLLTILNKLKDKKIKE